MKVFQTFTNLRLCFEETLDGYVVTLTGNLRTKLLYQGPDKAEATRVYRETERHYIQRQREEVIGANAPANP